MSDASTLAERLFGAPPPSAPPADVQDSARAARLYPSSAPPATATSLLGGAAPPADEPLAETSKTPPAIQAERKGNLARRLFDDDEFSFDALPELDAVEAGEVARDLGASGADVSAFVALAKHDVSDEARASWRDESLAMLKANEFGAADLALARRFVARDPRVFNYFDSTGLGDEPRVVKRVIEMARSAKAAGKKF